MRHPHPPQRPGRRTTQSHTARRDRAGAARRVIIATALLLPGGAAIATAQSSGPTPTLDGPATTAQIGWTLPSAISEDQRFSVGVTGELNGQATGHLALLPPGAACPTSPLYPRQLATGTRLTVTPRPAAPSSTTPAPTATPTPTPEPAATPAPTPDPAATPAPPNGGSPSPEPTSTTPATTPALPPTGTVNASLTLTERNSGTYRLCGWVVGAPATSEASTVAQLDQVVDVANRTSPITAEIPDGARSGDYFSVKVTGTAAGSGRRLLVMGEADRGQQCSALRKAASGKRPLQVVAGVPNGNFTKTLRLRYRTKTAGPTLLCIQVVEAKDRNPEGTQSRVMAVTESLKCVNTQTAIAQRRRDLQVIRKRRDAAQQRASATRKRAAPVRAKYRTAKRASDRRVAAARRAVTNAKTPAGKRSARQRLARVRKAEAARLRKARAPLRRLESTLTTQQRTYRQYRTGASLLNQTITRMAKDTKKYCAKPAG